MNKLVQVMGAKLALGVKAKICAKVRKLGLNSDAVDAVMDAVVEAFGREAEAGRPVRSRFRFAKHAADRVLARLAAGGCNHE